MFMMPSIIGFYPAENGIYAVLLLIFRFNYMAVALQQRRDSFIFASAAACKQNNFAKVHGNNDVPGGARARR